MASRINIGDVFGKLTVVCQSEDKRGSCLEWECLCNCGNTRVVPTNYLTTGQTWHCGCSRVYKQPKDITGNKNGRLTARNNTGTKSANGDYIWVFDCECGGVVESTIGRFNSNHVKSCGCLVKEASRLKSNYHGMKNTKTYNSWRKMRERCNSPADPLYEDYGGAGIKVCEEWKHDFKAFRRDMGDCPDGFTIDRVDLNKGYYKENCRWASAFVQARNKGSYTGSSKYKGVQYESSSGKWVATLSLGKYKARKIGRYLAEVDAAKAYNLASKMIFGEGNTFLHLNEVDDDYSAVNLDCKFFKHYVDVFKEEYFRLYKDDLSENKNTKGG